MLVGEELDGLVLGRFQPLHLGHMEYLECAKRKCRRLFIGITNPDPEAIVPTDADPKRSLPENNPFSYLDRLLMIEGALVDGGWSRDSFCFVPAPIHQPSRLASYLPAPKRVKFYVTIYDSWGEQKAVEFRRLGYEVEVLWRRSHSERLTSGTTVRAAIRADEHWQHLVPDAVSRCIQDRCVP